MCDEILFLPPPSVFLPSRLPTAPSARESAASSFWRRSSVAPTLCNINVGTHYTRTGGTRKHVCRTLCSPPSPSFFSWFARVVGRSGNNNLARSVFEGGKGCVPISEQIWLANLCFSIFFLPQQSSDFIFFWITFQNLAILLMQIQNLQRKSCFRTLQDSPPLRGSFSPTLYRHSCKSAA